MDHSIKNRAHEFIRQVVLSMVIFMAGNTSSFAAADRIAIAQTPLFLGAGVQPNIFFVSDDSGSMDWETMMPTYWRYDAYDPDRLRSGEFRDYNATLVDDGIWRAAEFIGNNDTMVATYEYLYDNADNVYDNDCNGDRGRAEICGDAVNSPFDVDWRARSSGLNKTFYNASIEYKPWSGPCGNGDCADAVYTDARSDPYSTQPGNAISRNLATNGNGQGGAFIYDVWIDDSGYLGDSAHADPVNRGHPDSGPRFNETGYASSKLKTGSAGLATDLANGEVDLWDSHMRFTVDAAQVNVKLFTYNPEPTVGATQGLNENTTFLDINLTGAACYNILGNDAMVRSIRNNIIDTPANASSLATAVGAPGCRTLAETRQNIANWYQYYRRRAFPVKNAVAAVIDAQPNFRYGMTLLNENTNSVGDIFIQVPAKSVNNVTAHNLDIKEQYFAYRQESNGTPLRNALQMAGEYYSDKLTNRDDPITYSCQKNFTILFTDGFWNGGDPNVGDNDSDNVPLTVADVAYKYYIEDINKNPLFADDVERDDTESDLPNTGTDDDPTTFQHMVTFTVAFGVTGKLVDSDTDEDDYPDFDYAGNSWGGDPAKDGNWGPAITGPDRIDDLWHAAYNTGGTFASASTPDEITQRLINAISNIAKRQSSASAVALNSGTLNANSRLYQAAFNSSNWSGSLKSIPIQDGPVDENPEDGNDDSPPECSAYQIVGELCIDQSDKNAPGEWNAAEKLDAITAAARNIFTFSAETNDGVEFKVFANLDVAQQTSLRTNPDTNIVELEEVGELRLDYIRGDDANEGSATSNFRPRASKLGDIIHSAPAFSGKPNFFYPDKIEASSNYNAYKILQKDRAGAVFVGANDGMLHAFDASNNIGTKGNELFAYIPGRLIEKLPNLTSNNYNSRHEYFVDGSPIVFDAFAGGGWKTLLASSAGAGGQLVFGLNVTTPSAFTANDVLWEFTDVPRVAAGKTYGDADLGYTIGDVSYARMNNGRWAVIFGNGFNNTEDDGSKSTTGNAVIYVVDAYTGELISKLDTGVGTAEDPDGFDRPNGISRVTPVDVNGDFRADYLYAGDLFGNVWKVDVTSATDTSWKFSKEVAGKAVPFHIAKDASGKTQPITTAVAVKRHPEKIDQTLVLFGTGSYFQIGDVTNLQPQTFYAIWDDGLTAQYSRSQLLRQEIDPVITVVIGADGVDREFRVTSSADINPAQYQIDWATHKGWYMDLIEEGERVNVEPILRGDRVIFVTLTPDENPCDDGGTSWIMELSANNGSRLKQAPFDVNGDGIINDSDVINFASDVNTITSGVRSKEGIVAKPGILNTKDENKELKYLSGTSGNIETVSESIGLDNIDRQSWRQLR